MTHVNFNSFGRKPNQIRLTNQRIFFIIDCCHSITLFRRRFEERNVNCVQQWISFDASLINESQSKWMTWTTTEWRKVLLFLFCTFCCIKLIVICRLVIYAPRSMTPGLIFNCTHVKRVSQWACTHTTCLNSFYMTDIYDVLLRIQEQNQWKRFRNRHIRWAMTKKNEINGEDRSILWWLCVCVKRWFQRQRTTTSKWKLRNEVNEMPHGVEFFQRQFFVLFLVVRHSTECVGTFNVCINVILHLFLWSHSRNRFA